MARVPYSPVREVVPDLQSPITAQTPTVNVDMFGGAQARGMQQAGQMIGQAGDALAKTVLEAQQIENEAMAREAILEGSKRIMDEEIKFAQQEGKSAVEGYGSFRQNVEAIRAQALGALPNPAVKRMADAALSRSMLSAIGQGATHSAREARAWNKETQAGLAAEAARQGLAAGDDATKVLEMGATMERNLRTSMEGNHPPEFINAQVGQQLGGYYKAAIEQAALRNPRAAQAMFEQVKPKLDFRSQEAIGTFLDGKVRDWDARGIAQEAVQAQRGGGGYVDRVVSAESGGDPNARNPRSSATGAGQFIDSTWLSTVKKHRPDLAEGKSDAELLALRTDGELSREMIGALRKDNAEALGRYGLPDTDANAYMAHWFGSAGAAGILRASPDTPIAQVLGADVIRANPNIAGKTAGDVVGMVTAKMGGQATITSQRPIDKSQALDFVIRRTAGDERLRDAALSHLSRLASVEDAMFAADRDKLNRAVADLEPALASGAVEAIPPQVAADLDRLLPPEAAARTRRELDVAAAAGVAMRAVQFGTPAEVAGMRETLATGSARDRTGAGGAQDAEGFRQREQIRARFETAVAQREAALRSDPAAYAAREPGVAAALALAGRGSQEEQKAAWGDYVTRSLAVQTRLGVSNPQILTDGQVASMVGKITKTDPATGDMMMGLNQFAAQFGERWPQAFGELVQRGKLPGEYQVLAQMTEPGQRVAADQLQRGLSLVAEKGGLDAIRKALPDGSARLTDQALDSELADFRVVTAQNGGGGVRLFQSVEGAAKVLAYQAVMRGESPSAAASAAVKGVLTERWELDGTAIYPKAKAGEVRAATRAVQSSLTAGVLAPVAASPETAGMTDEARQSAWVAAAQRGKWVPNKDTSGLVLMAQLFNGGLLPVRMADGSPVEVRFDALPRVGRVSAPPADGRPAAPVMRGQMDMPTFDLPGGALPPARTE